MSSLGCLFTNIEETMAEIKAAVCILCGPVMQAQSALENSELIS